MHLTSGPTSDEQRDDEAIRVISLGLAVVWTHRDSKESPTAVVLGYPGIEHSTAMHRVIEAADAFGRYICTRRVPLDRRPRLMARKTPQRTLLCECGKPITMKNRRNWIHEDGFFACRQWPGHSMPVPSGRVVVGYGNFRNYAPQYDNVEPPFMAR